jgi:hypothetical protein
MLHETDGLSRLDKEKFDVTSRLPSKDSEAAVIRRSSDMINTDA